MAYSVATYAGHGYAAGSGGTISQSSSKATGVILNQVTGEVTTMGSALAAATVVSFTISNSMAKIGDLVVLNHISGGTMGAYTLNASITVDGSITVNMRNNSAASLSESLVIRYGILKVTTA